MGLGQERAWDQSCESIIFDFVSNYSIFQASNSIYANSPGYRANLPLSCTGDQNPRIKRSLDQLPTKKDSSSIYSKIPKLSRFFISLFVLVLWFLASISCVMRVVRCKQKEESFFFVTLTQERVWLDEYSTNWGPWQIDPHFPAKLLVWGGGGVRELGGPN